MDDGSLRRWVQESFVLESKEELDLLLGEGQLPELGLAPEDAAALLRPCTPPRPATPTFQPAAAPASRARDYGSHAAVSAWGRGADAAGGSSSGAAGTAAAAPPVRAAPPAPPVPQAAPAAPPAALPAEPGPPPRRRGRPPLPRVEAPAPRGRGRRGRPPKDAAASYSAGYLSTKYYRERRKAEVHELATEVERKLAELRALTEENQLLRVQEDILNESVWGMQAPDEIETKAVMTVAAAAAEELDAPAVPPPPPPAAPPARAPAPRPAAAAGGGGAARGGEGAGGCEAAGVKAGEGAEAGAGASDDAAETRKPDPLAGRSPTFLAVVALYREYIRRMRARLQPDGTVRELHPWEEVFPPLGTIVPLYMGLTPEESFLTLVTNMETGEMVKELPPGAVAHAAQHLHLRPDQELRISAALDTFFKSMQRLWDERTELQERLSAMLLPAADADAGGAGGGEGRGDLAEALLQREEVLSMLRANMIKEDRMCSTMAFVILRLLTDVQRGTCIVHCWPFTPRFTQMCALKLGRKEVLDRIGLSIAMRRQGTASGGTASDGGGGSSASGSAGAVAGR